jgi:hypothetical protein
MTDLASLINRRRRQILVHSFLYYRLNESIISDNTFDLWAKELVDLQTENPAIASEVPYAKEFEGFDGSSGYDLPHFYPEIQAVGLQLLKFHKEAES